MALFYADEDFSRITVEYLRRLGHDVLTVVQDGRSNQRIEDHLVLVRANELGRILLTCNRTDFRRLHESKQYVHVGIVVCPQRHGREHELAQQIELVVRNYVDFAGAFVRIRLPSTGRRHP